MQTYSDISDLNNHHLLIPKNQPAEEIVKEFNRILYTKHHARIQNQQAMLKQRWVALINELITNLTNISEELTSEVKELDTLIGRKHSQKSSEISLKYNPKIRQLFSAFKSDFESVWPFEDILQPNLANRLIGHLKGHWKSIKPNISRLKRFRGQIKQAAFYDHLAKISYNFSQSLIENWPELQQRHPDCLLLKFEAENLCVDINHQSQQDIPECSLIEWMEWWLSWTNAS